MNPLAQVFYSVFYSLTGILLWALILLGSIAVVVVVGLFLWRLAKALLGRS